MPFSRPRRPHRWTRLPGTDATTSPSTDPRAPGLVGVVVLVAFALVVALVTAGGLWWATDGPSPASASGGATGHQHAAPPVAPAAWTGPPERLGPLTPADPTRLAPGEQAAIVALAAKSRLLPSDPAGHDHLAKAIEVPLHGADAATFRRQWAAAVAVVARYPTVSAAMAEGYVVAASPSPGVGTHYVKWSLIDQPFDPSHPSMLLFDERPGRGDRLVGLSYWVRSDAEPEGFAGPNDRWHQHAGLCVVNGWVDREESPAPGACAGQWLGGADLWMLHAWVVPAFPNLWGRFASMHPVLCPPAAGTPDILRCTAATE